jgi:ubiquinone/menaquinone biosynthesis C-methylase UbiE
VTATGPVLPGRSARSGSPDAADQQRLVNERFRLRARNWEELYEREDLFSVIHRLRHARALEWIDGLELPAGSAVLEVGPGAGLMTVALAQRGFQVTAADTAARMLEIARRRAAAAGVTARVRLMLADAQQLPVADAAVTLVVALGVLPWLRSADAAVAELTRVLQPGGYLILNADNRYRLSVLLDPRHNPVLDPARIAAKSVLRAMGVGHPHGTGARVTAHQVAEFNGILTDAGLELLQRCTFGFGPFTLLGVPVLPQRMGVRLHARLQRRADNGGPGVRWAGAQYLVVARAPLPRAGGRS